MIGKMMTRKGFSLMEMLVVVGILALLASASVPVAELAFNTAKEDELQTALERMREAINLYRRDCRNAVVSQYGYDNLNKVPFCNLCPPSLEALTQCHLKSDGFWYDSNDKCVSKICIEDGTTRVATFTPRKYLDAIPTDPFVGRPCWLIHVASGSNDVVAAYNFREANTTRGYRVEDLGKGITEPDPLFEPQWKGVFDVSCVSSGTVDADDYYTRRGFNISVDGTLYEDW